MSLRNTSILYLDDEENNLTAFKASFRREFTVHVTTQAEEAVSMLKENEVHLIIADQKMPDISGVEFLELVKSEFPDPVRMLLTGYADIEAVIDAINRGQVYRYITKPWDEKELRMVFSTAREYFDTKMALKRRNAQLLKAKEDLERFIYSASHDLRAPIASIKGIADLARTEQGGNPGEYLGMVRENINQIDYFTQNLINYYQNIQNEPEISTFPSQEWLEEVVCKVKSLVTDANFEINATMIPEIRSDRQRLIVLLNNLLVNAIEVKDHSIAPQKIDLEISEQENQLSIRMQDNGSGIPDARLKEIRDLLASDKVHQPGKGMGLMVVRDIVHKLNGSIQIDSAPDTGAVVSIKLKLNDE